MRVWLVLLLLALVAVVLTSAARDERRRSRPGRRRPVGGRGPRPGGGNGGEGTDVEEGEEGESGAGAGPGAGAGGGGKKKPGPGGRRGRGGKKGGRRPRHRGRGVFGGSPAMKKCSWCVIKCKKANRMLFEECLSTNVTTPCFDLCSQASDNMLDCLTCIGGCSGVVNAETGKKSTPMSCVKKPNAPCRARCAAQPAEVEGEEESEVPPAPPAPAWYYKYF